LSGAGDETLLKYDVRDIKLLIKFKKKMKMKNNKNESILLGAYHGFPNKAPVERNSLSL
jgi:vacuolar-type H+-ATPase subunit C/Vma6